MFAKLLIFGMILISWATAPLLGVQTIRRYLPSTIFISFVIMVESSIASKRKWWKFYKQLHPYLTGELSFILGPFIIGSIWIFKLSKGIFWLYMLLNLFIDIIFCYPLLTLFKKFGIAGLRKLKRYQLLALFLFKAVLMYLFQMFVIEKDKSSLIEESKE